MKFRLLYEGEIRPRTGAHVGDVHAIRQKLHHQIKRLYDHWPLEPVKNDWFKETTPDSYARIRTVGLIRKNWSPLFR
jgi:hypothetical protein